MITEFFFGLATTVAGFLAGLLPSDDLPSFFTDFSGQLAGMFRAINGLGAWAPFGYLGIVLGVVWTTYGVCFLVKLGLRAVSHAPVSGGAG